MDLSDIFCFINSCRLTSYRKKKIIISLNLLPRSMINDLPASPSIKLKKAIIDGDNVKS